VTGEEEDVIIGQRFVTPDLTRSEVASALKLIADRFGVDWLTDRSAPHPLRDLWAREDFIALQELFSLGGSIELIEAVDASWAADAIAQAKSLDRNNRAGYVFEIIAIAALLRGGGHATPAPPLTEAYDCDLAVPNGDIWRISLKKFGESKREADFRKNARAIAAHVRTIAEKKDPRWFGVIAEATLYPSDADWSVLCEAITAKRAYGEPVAKGNWKLYFTPPPVPLAELAASEYSFGTQIFAPHHKNESANFISSIERGCAKLNATAPTYAPNVRAVLMVHLSETADMHACGVWARAYLGQVPPPNLTGIFLLQSAVAQNLESDSTSIAHNFDAAWRAGVAASDFTISMQVGVTSVNPSRQILIAGDRHIPLDGRYWFSDVHLYRAILADFANIGAGVTWTIRQIPGHVTHSVLRSPDGEEMTLSPKHTTPDKLTLYS
jgi:hypothetical protein